MHRAKSAPRATTPGISARMGVRGPPSGVVPRPGNRLRGPVELGEGDVSRDLLDEGLHGHALPPARDEDRVARLARDAVAAAPDVLDRELVDLALFERRARDPIGRAHART